MKQLLIIICIVFFPLKAFSCECPEYNLEELDCKSYEWSDVIVIGDIVAIGTHYKIVVLELLKGSIDNENILLGTTGEGEIIDSCMLYPRKKGKYLLYLNKIVIYGKTYYSSSECLGTRTLDFEYYPIALISNKAKAELITKTDNWIEELRKNR